MLFCILQVLLNAEVAVSLNGQQFSSSAIPFHFYETPVPQAVEPASGTELGGVPVTIRGQGFSRGFVNLCAWGLYTTNVSWLTPTQLVCASPPAALGVVAVSITQNGQQYHHAVGEALLGPPAPLQYSTYVHPEVRALSVPGFQGELGSWLHWKVVHPMNGYTLVRAWGGGFSRGTDYRCKLNRVDVIPAWYDATLDCIACYSNLWLDGSNDVEVTLNGRQYTESNRSVEVNVYW